MHSGGGLCEEITDAIVHCFTTYIFLHIFGFHSFEWGIRRVEGAEEQPDAVVDGAGHGVALDHDAGVAGDIVTAVSIFRRQLTGDVGQCGTVGGWPAALLSSCTLLHMCTAIRGHVLISTLTHHYYCLIRQATLSLCHIFIHYCYACFNAVSLQPPFLPSSSLKTDKVCIRCVMRKQNVSEYFPSSLLFGKNVIFCHQCSSCSIVRGCFWELILRAKTQRNNRERFSEYQIGWNLKPDPSQHKCLLVHLPQDAAAQSHALLQTLLHSAASVWLFNFIYISLDTTCNSLSVASVKSSPIYEAMQWM